MQGLQRGRPLAVGGPHHEGVAAHDADARGGHPEQGGLLEDAARVGGGDGDDDAILGLAKQQRVGAHSVLGEPGQVDARAQQPRRLAGDKLGNGGFGEGNGQPAVGAVMGAAHDALADQPDQRRVKRLGDVEGATRRKAVLDPMHDPQPGGPAEPLQRVGQVHRLAQQKDDVALVLEPLGGDMGEVLDEANDGDGGGGVDGPQGPALVVEGAVAARDWRVEGAAGVGEAADGLADLPEDGGVVGLPKLRLSVAPNGSAPAQAMLRQASTTAALPPS